MNFEFSEDQRAFLSAVDTLVSRQSSTLGVPPSRYEYGAELQRELEEAGYLECAGIDELGRVAAVSMIMSIMRLPQCVELTGAALVAPSVLPDLPRPLAVCGARVEQPVRFLPMARTLIRIGERSIGFAAIDPSMIVSVDSVFAYPLGVLADPAAVSWREVDGAAPEHVRRLWRLGMAAEIVGCLSAGLDSVVDHVVHRRQFGRPLGSFQAIQHRLAECAVRIEATRLLVLKAADRLDPIDVVIALGQAQGMVGKVTHDLHQFMGAMGLTLEHPLHRWTYRARMLRGELGGSEQQFIAAANARWLGSDQKSGQRPA